MKSYNKLIISLIIVILIIFPLGNYKVYAYSYNSYDVKLHYISVGNADCILIECDGNFGLVDGGEGSKSYYDKYVKNSTDPSITKHADSSTTKLNGLTSDVTVIPYLKSIMGNAKLDFIIATHSHSDHIGGIPEIADAGFVSSRTSYYYKPYVISKVDETDRERHSWRNDLFYYVAMTKMKEKGAKLVDVTSKSEGFSFYLGKAKLNLYNLAKGTVDDKDENVNSIATLVTGNGKKVFLGADLERDDQNTIVQKIGKVDILKAAHHGAIGNTSFETLDVLKPNYVVVTNTESSVLNNSIFNGGALYLNSQGLLKGIYVTGKSSNKAVVSTITQNGGISFKTSNSTFSGDISCMNLKDNNWYKARLEYLYKTSYGLAKGFKEIRYKSADCTFYFNDKGIMQTGLQSINNKYYYFNSDGVMQKSQSFTIDGIKYTFGADGVCKNYSSSSTTTSTTTTNSSSYTPTTNTTNTTVTNTTKYVKSISIYKYPKTTYYVGDKTDFSSLALRLNYSDGTNKVIYSGFTTSMANNQALNTAGYFKVTVSYKASDAKNGEVTTSFYVRVNNKASTTTTSTTTSNTTTKLKATVSYSTTAQTTGPVTITVKANKELGSNNGSSWTLSEDKKSMSTTVKQNTKYLLVVHAKDGTSTDVNVSVQNIVKNTSSTNTTTSKTTTNKTTTSTKTGWDLVNGKYVYYKNGVKLTGLQKIGSDTYYFDNNGYMYTGWKSLNGKRYFFDNAGHMKTKWLYTTLNGVKSWFYFESDGSMVYGTSKTVDGKLYYFDSNGRCTNPY